MSLGLLLVLNRCVQVIATYTGPNKLQGYTSSEIDVARWEPT